MKAYVIHEWGDVENLKLEEMATPEPAASEVVIEVKAVGLNPFDYIVMSGFMKDMVQLPLVAGTDVAGIITAVGSDVADFQIGDVVMGSVNLPATDGSLAGRGFAQFVATPAYQVVKKPEGLSFAQAAALPAVGATAYQGLFDVATLKAGQTILIHGGSGGVGHIAVQLAHQAGAHVIATARDARRDFVLALGADEVIDYQHQKFEEMVKNVDVVFDTVGGKVMRRSLDVLKPGGLLVSTLWPEIPDIQEEANSKNVIAKAVMVETNNDQMRALAERVAAGSLKIAIDKVYNFDALPEALTHLKNDSVQGKLVVQVS